MVSLISALLVLPWIFAGLVLVLPDKARSILIQIGTLSLGLIAVLAWMGMGKGAVTFDAPIDEILLVADFALLVYFVKQGFHHQRILVWGLALLQIALLVGLLFVKPHEAVNNFYVDNLSVFMYLLINIVGGVIVVYAIQYMRDEECSDSQKRYFLAILLGFLGTMNFIVSVDNIKWFFLLFEMTTLASYLLIRFRMDEISINNALRALWMNQIGGVAILLGLIGTSLTYGTVHFSTILNQDLSLALLLPVAFLSIAALVKGAQLPFDKWLLGAMVAPTPVSAILHSATMVKIAPFLIIKLSPVLAGTAVGAFVALLGGFVFVSASVIGLSRDNFKEILAYSTVGLLGLMITMGAIGTTLSITVAIMLILFHGIAKALLFLEAGILEKVYHAKYLEQMNRLVEKAPRTTMVIIFGFICLTLPPFGAFFGKWLAVEAASFSSLYQLDMVAILFLVIIGSVVLTLLYFRVVGVILAKDGAKMNFVKEEMPYIYKFSTGLYVIMLLATAVLIAPFTELMFAPIAKTLTHQAELIYLKDWFTLVFGFTQVSIWVVFVALALMLIPIVFYFFHFENVDRVKEYACAERMDLSLSSYFFDIFERNANKLRLTGSVMMVLILAAGGL